MGRKPTGSTYEKRGVWYAAITVATGERDSFALPTCSKKEEADARKEIINDVVQRLRTAGHVGLIDRFATEAAERPSGKPLDRLLSAVQGLCTGKLVPDDVALDISLFREIGEAWTSGKLTERYRGQVAMRAGASVIAGVLEKHVYPHVGEIPIRLFTREHAQLVLNKHPKHLGQESLRSVAKFVNRIVELAASPLGLIQRSPLVRGWIPKAGPKKARTCLYPSEDVQLMACTEVSLCLRVLWGYLHREGHRKREALRLTFSDFDLMLGTINLDKNKTKQPRFWVLAPGVAAMLRAWKRYREEVLGHTITGSTLVFLGPNGEPVGDAYFRAAKLYRDSLQTAGIDRPQLTMHNGERRRIRAHDTRAAFVTVGLANGKNEVWIADRTGHSSMTEMETYRRAARTFAEANLGDWTSLDRLIPELQPYLGSEETRSERAITASSSEPEQPPQAPVLDEPSVTANPDEAADDVALPQPASVAADAAADLPCDDIVSPDGQEREVRSPICESEDLCGEHLEAAAEVNVGGNVGTDCARWDFVGCVGGVNMRESTPIFGALPLPTFALAPFPKGEGDQRASVVSLGGAPRLGIAMVKL